ncbi:MAG: hypothetical protein WC438_04925 [Candidatus Pacearchaeota archaeon]
MTDIFDYHVLPETPVLEELAEQLEDTLRVIAYADYHTNTEYIKDRQGYFRKITKNGKLFHECVSDQALLVDSAYWRFMSLLDYKDPEFRRETAENIIFDDLTRPDSDFEDEFKEYREMMIED